MKNIPQDRSDAPHGTPQHIELIRVASAPPKTPKVPKLKLDSHILEVLDMAVPSLKPNQGFTVTAVATAGQIAASVKEAAKCDLIHDEVDNPAWIDPQRGYTSVRFWKK